MNNFEWDTHTRNESLCGRTYKRNVELRRRDKTADRELVERSF